MHILVTAFDPFGGETVNASMETLKLLPDEVAGAKLHRLILPTVFGEAARLLLEQVEALHPALVLCLGQAAGRKALTPERVAINVMEASLPDNRGFQPEGQPLVPEGPAAYFATLPIKEMVAAIRDAGLPADISNTAGTFVCNDVMYRLLHRLALKHPETIGGFLHLPLLQAQAKQMSPPAFGLEARQMGTGVEAALKAAITHLRNRD